MVNGLQKHQINLKKGIPKSIYFTKNVYYLRLMIESLGKVAYKLNDRNLVSVNDDEANYLDSKLQEVFIEKKDAIKAVTFVSEESSIVQWDTEYISNDGGGSLPEIFPHIDVLKYNFSNRYCDKNGFIIQQTISHESLDYYVKEIFLDNPYAMVLHCYYSTEDNHLLEAVLYDVQFYGKNKYEKTLSSGKVKKLTEFEHISGKVSSHIGTIEKGSNKLLLKDSHDFKVGEGIAIKDVGNYYDGWLRTEIINIEGTTLFLRDVAVAAGDDTIVEHDDSEAIQRAINKSDESSATVIIWDIKETYAEGLKIKSYQHHIGEGCKVFTPKYCNQNNPQFIYGVFDTQDVRHITMCNFDINGGKYYGVNGNHIYGTSSLIFRNLEHALFNNIVIYNNWNTGFRMLDKEHYIAINNCRVENTDVAILFMPYYMSTANFKGIDIYKNQLDGKDNESEVIAILPAWYTWRNHSTGEVLASCEDLYIGYNTIIKRERVGLVYGGISQNVLIEHNYFESMIAISTYDKGSGSFGSLIDETGKVNNDLATANNVKINDNIFAYTKYSCTRIVGYNLEFSRNTITQQVGSYSIMPQDNGKIKGSLIVEENDFNLADWKQIIRAEKGTLGVVHFNRNHIRTVRQYDILYIIGDRV